MAAGSGSRRHWGRAARSTSRCARWSRTPMAAELAGTRPLEILLAEDREDDALLTREAFRRSGRHVNVHHVENGLECLAFLRKEDRHAHAPTPDLLLLDL